MAQANIRETIIPAYDFETAGIYDKKTGAERFKWTEVQENNPSFSAFKEIFEFRYNARMSDDVLFHMGLLVQVELCGANGLSVVHDPNLIKDMTIIPDTLFSYADLKFGSTTLNSDKLRIDKFVHLHKLMGYRKEYADHVKRHEYFYPDGEGIQDVYADMNPVNVLGVVDANGNFVVGNGDDNAVDVNGEAGVTGGAATALNGTPFNLEDAVHPSVTTQGYNYFIRRRALMQTQENTFYNDGYYERFRILRTQKGKIAFWIPLRTLIPALKCFEDSNRGLSFVLSLRLASRFNHLQLSPRGFDGFVYDRVATTDPVKNYKIKISDMTLMIPSYQPNPESASAVLARNNLSEIRPYVDYLIDDTPIQNPGAGTTKYTISNLPYKPIGIIALWQLAQDDQVDIRGNPHRFFNPQLSRASLNIGGVIVPEGGMSGGGISGESLMTEKMYLELLRLLDMTPHNANTLMTYERFKNNKFMACFDLRDTKFTESETFNGRVELQFDHKDIDTTNVPPTFRTGAGVAGNTTNTAFATATPNDSNYKLWVFAFVQRSLKIERKNLNYTIEQM
jgi:hypothetical protein